MNAAMSAITSMEQLLHLPHQTIELLALGLVFLVLLAIAFLLLRWHGHSNLPADDSGGDVRPEDSFSVAHPRGSSSRNPRFLLLGSGAVDSEVALDGVVRARGRSRLLADDPIDITHWFFDGGEVVSVADILFAPASSNQDSDTDWLRFLARLKRSRSRRPVDGIILNLSASCLIGSGALSEPDLLNRAAGAARRLQVLRRQLGFYLPVYVLISGCEAIDGFAAFMQAQPNRNPRQIFGWSSPRRPEAAFAAWWTAQAFAEVQRVLAGLRLDWFAQPASQTPASQETRDGLFLFPSNFGALETPVASFLNRMFQEFKPGGTVQFRGLYFSAALSPSSAALHPAPQPHFTLDLLQKKIAPERVLARPTRSAFARKAVYSAIASVACAVVALVLVIGTLAGWSHLSRASARVQPELRQVAAALPSAKGGTNASAAYAAIDAAQRLSGSNFRSVFLPVSMARPLDPEVRLVMPPVFTQLVYPALRSDLERKIADLVAPTPTATSPQSLAAFIDALLTLEDHVLLYNGLASAGRGGGASLMALTGYLYPQPAAGNSAPFAAMLAWLDAKLVNPIFNGDLSGLDAIVLRASGPVLDGQPWNVPTTARLAGMFADPNLEGTHLLATLGDASDGINQLSDPSLNPFQEPDQLNKLNATLNQLKAQAQSASAWYTGAGPSADIGKALQPIFSRPPLTNILLCDSTLRPNPCSNVQTLKLAIQVAANAKFDSLRLAIQNQQTATTGPLLDTTGKLQLSQPTAGLQSALQGYLKLPFVNAAGTGQLQSVTGNEQLLWDNNRLQAAIQDKAAYDSYYAGSLANAPDSVQDLFENAALDQLEAGMVDAVSSAQQFQPLPADTSTNAAALEAMSLQEARSFQAAEPSLNKVLDEFNELNFNEDYNLLEQVTTDHVQAILLSLNRAFDAMRLYQPPKGNFDSWTAGTLPSATAYQLATAGSMNTYLTGQMQEVQKFSAAAQIVVAYLQQHMLRAGSLPAAAAKWQGIAADLQKYSAAAPSSGIGSLEQFLAAGMDKTTPPDCQVPASQVNSTRLYFVQVRDSIEQELISRCHSLASQNATGTYTQFASFFNDHLKGKFPFSASPTAKDEANPDDVIKLFALLNQDENSIRQGLSHSSSSNGKAKTAIKTFLSQLDALRPLFASLLSGQPGAVPAFDIAPTFRVNRSHEVNGNQIADWQLTIGDSKDLIAQWTLGPGDATPRTLGAVSPGHWTYGNPMTLTLRWASDSPTIPVSTPPALVDSKSRTVTFQFRDSWSLLKMLMQMAAPAADFDRGVDPDPQTILIHMNQKDAGATGQSDSADGGAKTASTTQTADKPVDVFVRIRLFAPGKTKPLRIPVFPVVAPPPLAASSMGGASSKATVAANGKGSKH